MGKQNKIPVVWQISALHLNKKTLISGVLIKGNPFAYHKQIGWLKNLLTVIKSYFIGSYRNKQISITTNNITTNTITDKYGSFYIVVDFLYVGELKINIADNENPLKIIQTYPTVFQNTESFFDVISDIDDTIIVSYTADFFKRIGELTLTPPQKRAVIGFSQKMFDEFKKQDVRIFYVSKSESNLFGMLTYFIVHNNLPNGKLFLTPYLSFRQLLFTKKKKDFKIDRIRFFMKNSENKKYVLFGDDSQQDIDIYSKIIREFPQSILKVYIRQTKNKTSSNQERMLEKLKSLGVPVHYFKTDTEIDVAKEISQLKNNI